MKHDSKELNRLFAAAVVSHSFRQLLLTNPEQALKSGYGDEKFSLSPSEREELLSIKGTTLSEFARQLVKLEGEDSE